MRLQQANVADLRAFIAATHVGADADVSRATATWLGNGRREYERSEPLDADVPAWRAAAATVGASEFIRTHTGQATQLEYVAIVDGAPWRAVERASGAADGGLLGLTTANQAGLSRIMLPRARVQEASDALDALNSSGSTLASLTADQRRGVQLLTGTTLHEAIHAAAYSAPRVHGLEGMSAIAASPFTEGLTEAAADANSPAFLRSLLGNDVGDIPLRERDRYGYSMGQVDPARRLAALADPTDPAAALLHVATTVPVGQQAQELARMATPGADPSQLRAVAATVTQLTAHQSSQNSDAFELAFAAARATGGNA